MPARSGPARGSRPSARATGARSAGRADRAAGPAAGSRPGRRAEPSRRPDLGRPSVARPGTPPRTAAGAAARAGSPAAVRSALRTATGPPPRRRARPSTARVVAVVAVLALLLISYASTVRAYLNQRAQIAAAQAGIAARNSQISDDRTLIEHLSDPAYIQVIARQDFGLVLPGDHLYLITNDRGATSAAGTVATPSVGGARVTVPGAGTWWSRFAGSVGAAGAPAGANGTAATAPTSATPQPSPAATP